LALLLTSLAHADFQDGLDAHDRGDYETALKEWLPLAEQGKAQAQFNLGLLYQRGQGVPQDYTEAGDWYRQAAAQGHASAQDQLGSLYYYGQGVPQDYVQAHVWYNLAAAQGQEEAVTARDQIAKILTPKQIAEAQQLASEWLAQHQN
jgi:TPR repeat protein